MKEDSKERILKRMENILHTNRENLNYNEEEKYNVLIVCLKKQKGGYLYLVSENGDYLEVTELQLCKANGLNNALDEFKKGKKTANIYNSKIIRFIKKIF